ncbi:MAG: hypothetical protein M3478_07145 [Planctomycetota bacterium]|nr:hypothetical protein [Planctomycetota bacterium]
MLSVTFSPCLLSLAWQILSTTTYYRVAGVFFFYGPVVALIVSTIAAVRIQRSDERLYGMSFAVAGWLISFLSMTCAGILWTMTRGGGFYMG